MSSLIPAMWGIIITGGLLSLSWSSSELLGSEGCEGGGRAKSLKLVSENSLFKKMSVGRLYTKLFNLCYHPYLVFLLFTILLYPYMVLMYFITCTYEYLE